MRITLERADLLKILSKALHYDIQDDDITLNADPFEVHIRQVPVDDLAKSAEPPPKTELGVYADNDDTPGEEFLEDLPEEAAAVLTMDEVLRKNDTLRQDDNRTVGETPKEYPLNRPLGPYETEEPPPVTEDELRALTRMR